ncbi:hypothetical protein DFA_09550 [Cavenderia fasciculata]|uniref:Uncharacterized protein n=1 Tax=Cavenderia fasciculata TaxID=261658 RepID=F4Q7Y1_CACFS|nr:uncharacterized protein DFA_09550 [Cavenderia fasciculata]EGG15881.1 hypothetical protein DFA_09550 [Cavenderia fasciculata]|eukprot:XP_004352206.1 hypothetical protein DFA_09550 [Cavenderia fasciculata]
MSVLILLLRKILKEIRETSIYRGYSDEEMIYCLELYRYDDWTDVDGMLKNGYFGLVIDKIKCGIPVKFNSLTMNDLLSHVTDHHQFEMIHNSQYKDQIYTIECMQIICKLGHLDIVKSIHQQNEQHKYYREVYLKSLFAPAANRNQIHILEWLKEMDVKFDGYGEIFDHDSLGYKWLVNNFPLAPIKLGGEDKDHRKVPSNYPTQLLAIKDIGERMESIRWALGKPTIVKSTDMETVRWVHAENQIINDLKMRFPAELVDQNPLMIQELVSLHLLLDLANRVKSSDTWNTYNEGRPVPEIRQRDLIHKHLLRMELDMCLQFELSFISESNKIDKPCRNNSDAGSNIPSSNLYLQNQKVTPDDAIAKYALFSHLSLISEVVFNLRTVCSRDDDEGVELASHLIDKYIAGRGSIYDLEIIVRNVQVRNAKMARMLLEKGANDLKYCCCHSYPNLHPLVRQFLDEIGHSECSSLVTFLSRHARKDLFCHLPVNDENLYKWENVLQLKFGGWRLLKHMASLKKNNSNEPLLYDYHFIEDTEKSYAGTDSRSVRVTEECGYAIGRKGSIQLFDVMWSILLLQPNRRECLEAIKHFSLSAVSPKIEFIDYVNSLDDDLSDGDDDDDDLSDGDDDDDER